MANSQQKMPQRLELFYSNLNRQNMRRRLFYIYKWNIGRRDATREGYTEWLKGLVAWMEETTGVVLPQEEGFFDEYNGDDTEGELTPEEEEMFGEEEETEDGEGTADTKPVGKADEGAGDASKKGKEKTGEAADEVKDAEEEGDEETTPEADKPKEEKEGEAEAPGAETEDKKEEEAPKEN